MQRALTFTLYELGSQSRGRAAAPSPICQSDQPSGVRARARARPRRLAAAAACCCSARAAAAIAPSAQLAIVRSTARCARTNTCASGTPGKGNDNVARPVVQARNGARAGHGILERDENKHHANRNHAGQGKSGKTEAHRVAVVTGAPVDEIVIKPMHVVQRASQVDAVAYSLRTVVKGTEQRPALDVRSETAHRAPSSRH